MKAFQMLRNRSLLEGEATMKIIGQEQSIEKMAIRQIKTNANRLDHWLVVGETTTRHWRSRLRAVVIAGAILSGFVWGLGIGKEGLYFVLMLAIFGISFLLIFLKEP
jgi:predicted phage tail protein